MLLGMDTEETRGNGSTTADVAPFVGDSSARPAAALRGERSGRGWGRYGRVRMCGRRRRQVVPSVCHPLRLSDAVFSCSCLNGHHPRGAHWTATDGYSCQMFALLHYFNIDTEFHPDMMVPRCSMKDPDQFLSYHIVSVESIVGHAHMVPDLMMPASFISGGTGSYCSE